MCERAPYDTPVYPFHIDEDGDICDANGWLVCCPAREVWGSDKAHSLAIFHILSIRVVGLRMVKPDD